MEWIIIVGGIVFYFWHKGQTSHPESNLSESATRRAALYYLAYLLGMHQYDDIGLLTIQYMLKSRTGRRFATLLMGNLGTQQDFLGQIRLFAEFESLNGYNNEDIIKILSEVIRVFHEQGAVVNLDPKVQREMRQMEINNSDAEQMYSYKLSCIEENISMLFENVFHERFWDYQKRMMEKWNSTTSTLAKESTSVPMLAKEDG